MGLVKTLIQIRGPCNKFYNSSICIWRWVGSNNPVASFTSAVLREFEAGLVEAFVLLGGRPLGHVVVLLGGALGGRPEHTAPLREVNQHYHKSASYDHHTHQRYPCFCGVPRSSKEYHLCQDRAHVAATSGHPGDYAQRPKITTCRSIYLFSNLNYKNMEQQLNILILVKLNNRVILTQSLDCLCLYDKLTNSN